MMKHWTEERPYFLEGHDWEAVMADYLRVFTELGGPDDRLTWRLPIEDDAMTARSCCRFPLEAWSWHLEPTDEDLRWWPHLARIAVVHSVAHRKAPAWLPDHGEKSLGEFSGTLWTVAEHIAQAAHLLASLRGCSYRTRAPVPTEQARTVLYQDTIWELGDKWIEGDGSMGLSRLDWQLRGFANHCAEAAHKIDGLNPDDYKVGAERFDGLIMLVFNAGAYWNVRKGKPSAEKVERKDGITDPPFVRFVQKLCEMTGQPQPTRLQVRTGILRAVEQGIW